MRLAEIAAVGRRGELGKGNRMVFDLPGDLRFFAKTTRHHPVVMGKNTWLSLPGKLKDRKHLVISRSIEIDDPDVTVYRSAEEFLQDWKDYEGTVFCIGGGSLYRQMLERADELILTEVEAEAEADVFFPAFDKSQFERHVEGEGQDHGISYQHVCYRRKGNEQL